MAKYNGTVVVSGMLSPTDTIDTYPTHEDTLGKGGYRSVATLIERDGIPTERIKDGMLVYVASESKIYIRGNGSWNFFSDSTLDTSLFVLRNEIYTNTTMDGFLAEKADSWTVYTKEEVDAEMDGFVEFIQRYELLSNKGIPEGYASLDINGKVPLDQLYAGGSVKEFGAYADLPVLGEIETLYVITSTDEIYRWDTTNGYTKISSTSSITGDLSGHTSDYTNPHNVTTTQLGLGNVDNTSDLDKPISTLTQTALDLKADITDLNIKADIIDLTNHISDISNPHNVTATQIGLDNVNNTSDIDKPISNLTQSALDLKADTSELTTHITDYTNPHNVTATQVGLGNVDNTADLDKPISTLTQSALDTKTALTEYNIFKTNVETLLSSDTTTLNDLQEIVDYIKLNRIDLDTLSISNIIGLQSALDAKTAELTTHITDYTNPHNVTKTQIGLGNVDNTSDLDKPISTLTQEALDNIVISTDISGHTTDYTNPHNVTASQVNLGNVDNTSDLDKPISTLTQGALDLKADNTDLTNHISDYTNPHNVTAIQVNLGNVDNTSDLDKPISTLTQSSLDTKADNSDLITHTSDYTNPHNVTATQVDAYTKAETTLMVNTHISSNNPHNVTAEVINTYEKGYIDTHINNTDNPHNVTAEQLSVYKKDVIDLLLSNLSIDYTRTDPVTVSAGGVAVGETFSGTVQDALDRVFYTYPKPSFTKFLIDGLTLKKEYDEAITAGTYIVQWVTNHNDNIDVNSITIRHGLDVLGTNLPNTGSAVITIPNDITSSVVKIERFEIYATNTIGEVFHRYFDMEWIEPISELTVVNSDSFITDEDTPIDMDVLANDTDTDSSVSPVVSFATIPQNGISSINSNGTIRYVPNLNFNGTDSFAYINAEGTVGVVSITVDPIEDLTTVNSNYITTSEDTEITFDVISDDTDPEGNKAVIATITQPSHGIATIKSNKTEITYVPSTNYYGSDLLTYTNTEGNTGTVYITVTSINDKTVVNNNSVVALEDTPLIIDVLSNDTDIDSTKSPVSTFTNPSNGSVVINSDGTLTYTPNANFNGTDSFLYINTEGSSGAVTVTVSAVADLTTVVDDAAVTTEGSNLNVNVISNDYNVDGTPVAVVQSVTTPTNGLTEINPDGTIKYTPNNGFYGADSFTYTNTEGTIGTVTVTVNQVINPTIVLSDSFSTSEDTLIDIDVLANDTAGTSGKAPVSTFSQPVNGGVSLNAGGTLRYTPNSNFFGTDTFTYTNTENNQGTVTITVNAVDDTTAVNQDNVVTNEDTPVTFYPVANDTDVDSTPSTVISITPPSFGTAVLNANSSITYTPNTNYNGVDNFTYTNAEGTTGQITITINSVDDTTIAVDDTATTDKNTLIDINVLANDLDPDSKSKPSSVTQPAHGSTSINADGTIRYVPNTSFYGIDNFQYTNGNGNSAAVTVTVNDTGSLTVVNNDSVTTNEDQYVDINVLGNDTNVGGAVATVISVSTPQHGTAVINASQTIRYIPAADFNGTDQFTYTNAEGTIGSVTVTVNPVNDITNVLNDVFTVNEDNSITIDVLANDTDIDTKSPVNTVTQPSNGSVAINPDGTLTYTPYLNFNGTDVFMYSNLEGNSGTVTINVAAVNDATVIVDNTATVAQDNPITIDVLANDTDIDSAISTVTSVTQPTNGTTNLNLDGTITYTPNSSFYGSDSFTYTNSEGSVGNVVITVTQYQGTPFYYGVWEYNTAPLTLAQLQSEDFTTVNTKTDLAGQYIFNAKKYDDQDPDWPGTNSGLGAYHVFVYPSSWRNIDPGTGIIDDSNGFTGGWANDTEIVINSVAYRVLRTSYENYAGDYSYTVS